MQIGIFIGYLIELSINGEQVGLITGVPHYSPLVFDPARRYEVWRFFTYMFIHQG